VICLTCLVGLARLEYSAVEPWSPKASGGNSIDLEQMGFQTGSYYVFTFENYGLVCSKSQMCFGEGTFYSGRWALNINFTKNLDRIPCKIIF